MLAPAESTSLLSAGRATEIAAPARSTSAVAEWWPLALLALVTWVAHFLHSAAFGLYEDDWWFIGDAIGRDPSYLAERLRIIAGLPQGRPIGFFLPELFGFVGDHLGGLETTYVLGYLVVLLNVVLCWRLLRTDASRRATVDAVSGPRAGGHLQQVPSTPGRPGEREEDRPSPRIWTPRGQTRLVALAGALLFALFPADSTKPLLTHDFQLQPSLTFLLLASLLYLNGRRLPAYLVAIGSLLSYESAYLVFIAVPLLRPRWDRALWREVLRHAAIVVLLLALAVVVRVLVGEGRAVGSTGGALQILPVAIAAMVLGPIRVVLIYLYVLALTIRGWTAEQWVLGALSAVVLAATFAWLARRSTSTGEWRDGLPRLQTTSTSPERARVLSHPIPPSGAEVSSLATAYSGPSSPAAPGPEPRSPARNRTENGSPTPDHADASSAFPAHAVPVEARSGGPSGPLGDRPGVLTWPGVSQMQQALSYPFVRLGLAGLAMLALAYTLSFTHFPPNAVYGRGTSVHIGATLGASVLFAAVMAAVEQAVRSRRPRMLAAGALGVYLGLLVGYHLGTQLDFARSWAIQRTFWSDAVPLIPDAGENTIIIYEREPVTGTRSIDTNSWADALVLDMAFRFPPRWQNPPRLFSINPGWEERVQPDGASLQWWTPGATWDEHWEPFPDQNVIVLRRENGQLVRVTGSIPLAGRAFPVKPAAPGPSTPPWPPGRLYATVFGG